MTILVDRPVWHFRGERWSHLVSDLSFDELHEFAAALGVPRRAFHGDHYDIPERLLDAAIDRGAELVDSRMIVRRLRSAGLRRRPSGSRQGHEAETGPAGPARQGHEAETGPAGPVRQGHEAETRQRVGGHGTLGAVSRTDHIHLELPAVPVYGRVMRIAAAHLALRRGFSLHEIDDLRLAMDEAAVLLLGPDVGGERVEVSYAVEGNRLGIEARVNGEGVEPLSAAAIDRFETIIGELVDDHHVDAGECSVTVTKRHH